MINNKNILLTVLCVPHPISINVINKNSNTKTLFILYDIYIYVYI